VPPETIRAVRDALEAEDAAAVTALSHRSIRRRLAYLLEQLTAGAASG